MFFKYVKYGLYMLYMQIRGLKYEYIKRFKGIDEATKYSSRCMYNWSRFTIETIGIEVQVEGKENIPKGPCVFIGNHTSILDIPIVYYAANRIIGFISKKEILKVPVLGYWLPRCKCIALDRSDNRDAVRVIKEGVNNIKDGYSMMIFPEGTRSKDGKLRDFKKGSLKLATIAKVPIVPITIDGAFRSFEKERKFKPEKIRVIFEKPIETKDMNREEQNYLSIKVKEVIERNLSETFK